MTPIPKTRAWSQRSRETWKGWWNNPVSKQWTGEHVAGAERLIEQINDVEALVHQRERRLQERDIRAQERWLGLRVPVKVDEEVEEPEPPQPRDVPLRVPDLGLLYTGERAVFIHPAREVIEGRQSLGALVVQHIERWYVFGPGELRGQPATVSDEQLALIHAIYALEPDGSRVFGEVDLCWRKSTAKSTLAGWLCLAELDPDAPVRFGGWSDDGSPRGQGVVDPYIPIMAFTEGQAAQVTFHTALAVAKGSLNSANFRITDNWLMRADDTGKVEPVSGSPSARDGAVNTSFTGLDEGHRLTSDRLHECLSVMAENRRKRKDGWSLCTTTSWEKEAGSFAEVEDERARTQKPGGLLYVWRGADPARWDLTTEQGAAGALAEASPPGTPEGYGVIEGWRSVKDDPVKLRYWARVWCNIPSEGEATLDRPAYTEDDLAFIDHTPFVDRETEVALGLAHDGKNYVIAATTIGGDVGWIVRRCRNRAAVYEAVRQIREHRPAPFALVTMQLNRDRWLPQANTWAADKKLSALEHRSREEPDIIGRYLEAKPRVWLKDDATRDALLRARAVDLPDGRTTVPDAGPELMALAVSYDAAQTAVRKDLRARKHGVKLYG